jgi:hypothetical protein
VPSGLVTAIMTDADTGTVADIDIAPRAIPSQWRNRGGVSSVAWPT